MRLREKGEMKDTKKKQVERVKARKDKIGDGLRHASAMSSQSRRDILKGTQLRVSGYNRHSDRTFGIALKYKGE